MKFPFLRLAEEIKHQKISATFGVPGGGESLNLIDALERIDVLFFTTHHEASAAIIAGTYGRLKNSAGIAISIKGPGLANMVPGLAVCFFEHLPLIALVESPDQAQSHISRHKWVNHQQLASPVIKQYIQISSADRSLDTPFQTSMAERPGPVLCDLSLTSKGSSQPTNPYHPREISANPPLPKELLSEIRRSKRPIFIVGSVARRSNWKKRLRSFRFPLFTTVSAKGVIDEASNPYSAGIFSGAGGVATPEHLAIHKADLVIGLGLRAEELLRLDTLPPSFINIDTPETPTTSHIDSKRTFFDESLEDLFSILDKVEWGISEITHARNAVLREMERDDFLPISVFEVVSKIFGSQGRLVLDTGNFCTIAEHFWQAKTQDEFILAGNSRFMGTSIPMAIGAALADPNRPVIVGVGDGGISMHLSEFRLIADECLPIIILLLSDGAFGSITQRAIRDNLSLKALVRRNPSWKPVIENFGITSFTVGNDLELYDALDSWKPSTGPRFIECRFSPEPYRNMVSNIR